TAQTPTSYEDICALVPDDYEILGQDPAFLEPLEEFTDTSAPVIYDAPRVDVPGFYPKSPPEWFVGASLAQIIDQGFPILPDDQIPGDGEEGFYLNYSTKYIGTFLDPDRRYTDLAVVRIKAPRTPATEEGEAVDPVNDQVRYWSVCVHQMSNINYLWGCAYDGQFKPDPGSTDQITIVFSNESDRPAGLCSPLENGKPTGSCQYNWMPYASSTPLILMRQLTPNPDFAQAALFYEGDPNDSDALAAHMGAYFPRSTYCSNLAWYRHRCTR
ncbi:MAG: hypothetical protein KDH09_10115, partial [Chrysiogenetes bacterium]|nr:hypothetical protein [Chrysiogenetes bacterium]